MTTHFDFSIQMYLESLILRYGRYLDYPPRFFVMAIYRKIEASYHRFFFPFLNAVIYFALVLGILAILVLIFKSEMRQAERRGERRVSEQWYRARR